MKKSLSLFFLLIFTFAVQAQIIFEKGYFVNNAGEKTECLIRNVDWKNNPSNFEYKLTETATAQQTTIESVKEFRIYDGAKFIRATVDIDRSSDNLSKLKKSKNPNFKEELLFLKVLIEGEANLFTYRSTTLRRFFYQMNDAKIEQLIYKRYLTKEDNIGSNNRFRQQIANNLKCEEPTVSKINVTDYTQKGLTKLFVDYHVCHDYYFDNFAEKQKGDLFKLTARPGLKYSTLNAFVPEFVQTNYAFDSETGFRIGLEAEFILPFNKNKWSIIVEPTYQSFKGSGSSDVKAWEIDYQSLEIPLGCRHYIFLNDKSKVFFNAAIVLDLEKENLLVFTPGIDLDIDTKPNFAVGAGYVFNNKLSVELRGHTARDLLGRYAGARANYRTFSFIVGYSFL